MNTALHSLWAVAAPRRSLRYFSLFILAALFTLPLYAAGDDDDRASAPSPAAQPASQAPSQTASAPPTDLWNQPYMFNWGPERQRLADNGLTFTFFYITDAFGDLGVSKGTRTEFNGWYRIRGTVDVDFGKFTSAKGLTFHITGLWQGGQNMGAIIGSIANPSGLVSIHTFRLDSAWLQQSLLDGKVVITGGQMAAQDFYGLALNGGNYLMEPLDYNFGNMGNVYASWDPASGPAGNIKIAPFKHFFLQTGIFSGRNYSDTGWNYTKMSAPTYDSEVGFTYGGETASGKTYPGIVKVGSIFNNAYINSDGTAFINSNTLLPTQSNYLVYLQAAQAIYRMEPGSNRGLDVLFGVSASPSGVLSVVNQEYKGGVSFNGPFGIRPKDSVSFGLVYSKINGKYNDYLTTSGLPTLANETAIEINYKAQLTPWLILQPTMQHYSNVGGIHNHAAYLAGFRLQAFF